MKSPDRLDTLDSLAQLTVEKLKIDPDLWNWVTEQYATALRETEKSESKASLTWIRIKNGFDDRLGAHGWDIFGSEPDSRILETALITAASRPRVGEYKVMTGDTLSSVAKERGTSAERLLELNPGIKNPDNIYPSQLLRIVETPPQWPETRIIANLDRLLREGNTNAVSFFLEWIKIVGPHSFKELDYKIGNCLTGMASHTNLWSVPVVEMKGNREQVLIRDCLARLHAEAGAARQLLPCVASTNRSEVSIALKCLTATRDESAKEAVLLRLKKGRGYDFEMYALDYLEAVGATNDLAVLKQIAEEGYKQGGSIGRDRMEGFRRQRIENAMMSIRLNGVLERSLAQ